MAKKTVIDAVSAQELRAEVEAIGGLLPLLKLTDPSLSARFYEEVGLVGIYDPKARVVDLEARVLNDRVGGAITPLRTRIELA